MLKQPIVVLWVGGGQDSTALLYKFAYDQDFRNKYLPNGAKLLAVMADTGNEYPDTYTHVEHLKSFCSEQNIEFHFVTPDMGFHGKTWQSLQFQMERNSNIFSVALPKSCTDKLKIDVCYKFLEDYLMKNYDLQSSGKRKRIFYEYKAKYGSLTSIIGFAKGEETRILNKIDTRPKWMQLNVVNSYPLVEMEWDRAACQSYIRGLNQKVPMPSNCMMCPFQNEAEIVYLHRFHPEMWNYWVERENAKLAKHADKKRNLGVKGEKTLGEFLELALKKFGHWSDTQLIDYRFTHGHCVMSKY